MADWWNPWSGNIIGGDKALQQSLKDGTYDAKARAKNAGKSKTGVTVGNNPMGTNPVVARTPGPVIPGMVSQAPGGWDPNSRFQLDPTIVQGNTGDTAAPIGMDAFLASLMQPSAADSAAAAKARQDQQALDYYAGNILDQISTGSYKQPYTDMSGALAKYLETATGNINTAYDSANKAALAAQTANPYTNMVGTAAETDPGLMSLLQSQGLDTGASQTNVLANREAEKQRVTAYNDMLKAMGLSYGARATGRIADVAQGRTNTLADLTAQNAAYGSQISGKQAEALQGLNDKLLEAASKGANVTGQKKELATKAAKAKADKAAKAAKTAKAKADKAKGKK